MSKTWLLEIALEQGAINRIVFNDEQQALTELSKLKEKMCTPFGKNAQEVVELNGPAERYNVVVGRVISAAVIDKFEHDSIQQETNRKLDEFRNQSWITQTRAIIDAGLGDYIKR